MHFKRRRAKNCRAGSSLSKLWKLNGVDRRSEKQMRASDRRRVIVGRDDDGNNSSLPDFGLLPGAEWLTWK